MKNLTITIILALTLIYITGCKSTDPIWDAEQEITTNEIEFDDFDKQQVEEAEKAEYLARYLMSSEERAKLTNTLMEKASTWDHTSVSAGFFGSAILTGNPFSSGGSAMAGGIMMGLDIITAFMPDGSLDDTGRFWLPAEVDGVKLTEKQASFIAREKMINALLATYSEFGIELTCVSFCVGPEAKGERLYRADLTQSQVDGIKAKFGYTYVPRTIQVFASLQDMFTIKNEDKLESLALGFKPSFVSGSNGFQVKAYGDYVVKSNGDPVMQTKFEGYLDQSTYLKPLFVLAGARIGRDIERSLSRKIPWIKGTDDYKIDNYVVYNGKFYRFFAPTDYSFIEQEVIN
jgi:hypothetical protein